MNFVGENRGEDLLISNANENANCWQNFFSRKNRADGIVLLSGEIYVTFSMVMARACSTETTSGLLQMFLTGQKQTKTIPKTYVVNKAWIGKNVS